MCHSGVIAAHMERNYYRLHLLAALSRAENHLLLYSTFLKLLKSKESGGMDTHWNIVTTLPDNRDLWFRGAISVDSRISFVDFYSLVLRRCVSLPFTAYPAFSRI